MRPIGWPPLILSYLVAAMTLAAASLAALFLLRRDDSPEPHRLRSDVDPKREVWPLTIPVLVAALGTVGFALSRFSYVYDDFRFLFYAWREPWRWDESMRLLTVNAVFWLADSAPDPKAIFIFVNALAMILLTGGWALALRNACFQRSEALLAGALLGLSPFLTQLVSRAAGIENLAGMTWLIGCTLVFQWSARLRGSRKLAAIGLLASLTMLGCFVKFPILAPLPAWLWLWSRWDPSTKPLGFRLPLGLAALFGLGLFLGLPGASMGLLGDFSFASVASNARRAIELGGAWASALALPLAILFVAKVTRVGPLLSTFAALRRTPLSMVATTLRELRVRSLPTLRWTLGALALAVVALSPALFNGKYFAVYYLLFAMPPLTAILARALASVAPGGGMGVLASVLAAALLVPVDDFRALSRPTPERRASAWLRELKMTVHDAPEPPRLALRLDCPEGRSSPEDEEELFQLFLSSGERDGIRWGIGWIHAEVAVIGRRGAQPRSDDLTVGYCPNHPLRRL